MRSLPRASRPWSIGWPKASPSLLLAGIAGCLSAEGHREKADRSAASIIEEKQREVYGQPEPFTIDRPSETFRQKLLLAQGLPHTGTESYTAAKLEPVPHWPEEGYPSGKLPPEEVEGPWEGPSPYVMSLTDALKIGARNSRDYQTQKEATMHKLVATLLCLFVAAHTAFANDNAKLVGTWKLIAWDVEFQNGEPSRPYLGQKWIGYTVFTPEGRTMSVWEAEGRKPANTDEERAALFRSMNAITGTIGTKVPRGSPPLTSPATQPRGVLRQGDTSLRAIRFR